MKKEYLECARITGTHGVRGALKAESWCDTPQVLCGLKTVYFKVGDTYVPHCVTGGFVHKGLCVLTVEGITSPEQGAALRGTLLYAAREDIPLKEGEVLLADLLGCDVRDADTDMLYGKLTDIDFMPASAVYTVTTPDGREVAVPAVPQFIVSSDPERGILMRPIPGFFDGEEEIP